MSRDERPDSDQARGRDLLRQVAEVGRDAARTARQLRESARNAEQEQRAAVSPGEREAARAAAVETRRLAREMAREAGRETRDALRDVVRITRAGGRPEPGEPGTRTRIQQVAVELFTENGYEATSLREIAERLGVTKAALYYHFKTKDEIIESLVDDQIAMIEEILEWAEQQPRTQVTRREFVRRYSAMLAERDHYKLMRFFERNQSSMQQHKAGGVMRQRMTRMMDVLTEPGAPLTQQIRCSLAIIALHSTLFTVRDPDATGDERQAAALEVALDLID